MNGMNSVVVGELAPSGVLYAGINLSNPLLVTGQSANGDPTGIAPSIAASIARELGVPCAYKIFPRPGETADAVSECGVVLIAAEPERAQTIAFSPGYVEIEATYLVRPDAAFSDTAEVDREGVRIVVSERSAYDLWLTRHITKATLVRINGLRAAFEHFRDGSGDVLAGLRPALLEQTVEVPGFHILESNFTTVAQAVGTLPGNKAAVAFLAAFIGKMVASGEVAEIVSRHGVKGLKIGAGLR